MDHHDGVVRNHQQMVDLIHRTHQIFCGIKGKDILLLSGNPPGRTDTETFISVPMEDTDARLIHSHEWQHIFFKSNLRARASFAESYSESLVKRLPTVNPEMMIDFIHLLVNGLDDIRVCSLWELIYPHSANEVQERWRRIIIGSGRYQHDIVLYVMGLGLDLDGAMDRSEWKRYKNVLKDAVEKVIRRGFPTCLLAARWIVESILSDITAQYLAPSPYMRVPPKPVQFIPSSAPLVVGSRLGSSVKFAGSSAAPTVAEGGGVEHHQADALVKLHHGSTKISRTSGKLHESWRLMDTDRLPTGPDPEWRSTEDMVRVAMGVSTSQQVAVVLKQSQLDVDRIISELKNRTKILTPAQRLLKGMEGNVDLRTIASKDVDELHLSEEDKRLSIVLKHSFIRLMDRKKQVTSDSGSTLDPQAYIDFLNGSSNTDIFVEEESSRGFSALILLDMSGSMMSKWDTVARACKVVAQSMKFPCSQLEVWGFTSTENGVATLLRFEDTEKGYSGPGVKDVWGLTPLHIAVEVSLRRLQAMPGSAQHLIVLTDGFPTHLSINREIPADTGDLILEVARHVQKSRKRGVNVVGLISGYEVNDAAATTMFGHRRFWTRVSEQQEDIFQALVGLVRKAFVGYLRGK